MEWRPLSKAVWQTLELAEEHEGKEDATADMHYLRLSADHLGIDDRFSWVREPALPSSALQQHQPQHGTLPHTQRKGQDRRESAAFLPTPLRGTPSTLSRE